MTNKIFRLRIRKIAGKCILCFLLLPSIRSAAQTVKNEERKIDSLLRRLSFEEKVAMVHASSPFATGGVPRLGIPPLVMSDGPHGVRKELDQNYHGVPNVYDSVTYLPVSICLAASWNPDLGYQYGSVLGSEAAYRKKDVILGPGVNIIRSPLNGRNFEYLSEDPLLSAKMAVGYIKGVQDQGISACVKHFVANNQETGRETIDVQMSERALREIYLPAFKAAVTEGKVNAVMGAYNQFRGEHAAHNAYTINKILKGEWNFDGVLISDWGAVHHTGQALTNGTDIEMGSEFSRKSYDRFYMGDTLKTLLAKQVIADNVLDDKVRRILRIMYRTHMLEGVRKPGAYNTYAHQRLALKVAEEGIVLLKNDGLLPLNKKTVKSIAVIGANATRLQASGGGSSGVKAFYEITPLKGLESFAKGQIKINYAEGFRVENTPVLRQNLIDEAVKAAAASDVAVVFGGWIHNVNHENFRKVASYDSEERDKKDMDMPFYQNELIAAVRKANPKTIVVLMGGGSIDMTAWVGNVPALLEAWYPGMEGGTALAKILFGEVNPSGKLPVTLVRKLDEAPAIKLGEFPGDGTKVVYKDDIFVGYRYFDSFGVAPQFPFGYGLSYTKFKFSAIRVKQTPGKFSVACTVTNTGKRAGAEVIQLYVKAPRANIIKPEKELKSFRKVFLRPGASRTVNFTLNDTDLSYFNEAESSWKTDPGIYKVLISNSSRDIKLEHTITLPASRY